MVCCSLYASHMLHFPDICTYNVSYKQLHISLQNSPQIQHLNVSSSTSINSGPGGNATNCGSGATTPGVGTGTASGVTPITTSASLSPSPVSSVPPSPSICSKNLLKELTVTSSGGKPQSLTQRIKFLQSHLAHAPMPSITSKRRQLLSIEEAWNLPISAEMSSRQQQQSVQANQQRHFQKGGYNQVSIVQILSAYEREKLYKVLVVHSSFFSNFLIFLEIANYILQFIWFLHRFKFRKDLQISPNKYILPGLMSCSERKPHCIRSNVCLLFCDLHLGKYRTCRGLPPMLTENFSNMH